MSLPLHAFDYRTLPLDPAAAAETLTIAEFFAPQPATRAELPDSEPLLARLTHLVIEILAGSREIDQIARWLSDDVHPEETSPR
ncbi:MULTISPECIES: Rv3235 family protein [unclassified Rathayibacter]|uniref:Rv3235 family protein n=1 Tax=unclassified Rathayibacter TaxID=2609250 RepID=UPI000CE8FFDD|nr:MULTISPECIES: Rv3235 family protein [unclassified Rathayibacter]PPF20352.1 hypothetical protein C5B92_01420 [Rathayibacter sp. AY1A4]PPG83116.1 hypothetical protein C5C52_03710 [Rathayibacter sp. AY1E5]PPH33720.1 hypothetical protein C5C94_02160 [Rathayibacter sp. AY1C3]PPH65802.1 hypothetical protein C5D25_03170 [Rathayibacter sp. AY1D7]PPH65803.1 hypothetical protein C5D25_03195 [Rathayibacter sp. AY1D7]